MITCSPRNREHAEASWGGLAQKFAVTKEEIYRGLASTIFLGIERGTFLQVGVKVISKSRLDSPEEALQALQECELHAAIPPHPNVSRLLAAEETPGAIVLVTPYTPHGDLWELVRYGRTYCEAEVRNCAGQMFSALRHIHVAADLIHGDIKPQNFLLFKQKGRFTVQLCDFGLAEHPNRPRGKATFRGLRGTSGWFSPEMLAQVDYGQAVDIFAVGLILFRMLGGYAPFDPPSRFTEPADFDERYWGHISGACKQLLAQVLSFEPLERRCSEEICEHAWLAGEPPPAPTEEELARAKRFGPLPDESTCFWPLGFVPKQEQNHSFANLQDLVSDEETTDIEHF